MKLQKLLALMPLFALLMTACGGDIGDTGDTGADDTGGEPITLETIDNEFRPSEFAVAPVGGETEIMLDNTGEAEHNFSNEELGVDQDVAPGEQVTFTVDAEPGRYEFVCKYHESLGMTGTMRVATLAE